MVGKSKKQRAFKNVKTLPIFYKNQSKAWMTAALFTEWYDEIFIPQVKKHQKFLGKEGNKVLLVVDNAPSHPTEELLEREDGQFRTIFSLPNVTSLLQPMDQSVIETMKCYYRRQLLRKLLIEGEDEEGVLTSHKKLNLKDCAYMVVESWSLVTAVTLTLAWNKLKSIATEEEKEKQKKEGVEKTKREETEDDEDDLSLEGFRNTLLKIPGCSEVTADCVAEWMVCDSSDTGFQILNDDELIESVREGSAEEEDDLNVEVEADTGPSPGKAFVGLEIALKWMKRQPECDHMQLLTLKRMRDLAA